MPTEIFQASRWTKGNLLFPTCIEVSDKSVTRRKRSLFRMDEESMSIPKVRADRSGWSRAPIWRTIPDRLSVRESEQQSGDHPLGGITR